MAEERRNGQRVRAYRPVRLQPANAPGVIETLTKDLGVGGLRCLSATPIPVSSELAVELSFAQGDEPLSVRGRATWFRAIPQSEQFDLGISFLEMSHRDKRRLSAYIDRISSHQPVPA